jgi:hypothetical protein
MPDPALLPLAVLAGTGCAIATRVDPVPRGSNGAAAKNGI